MEKPAHPSDSRVQLEIEKKVVAILSEKDKIEYNNGGISIEPNIEKGDVKIVTKKENIGFKSGGVTEEKINFNFDFHFFSKDLNIIGEIYAGIDKISAGSRKKIITDCFKMIFAEKLLGYECDKRLIFINEDVKKTFIGDSWAAKAIEKYKIKAEVVKIPEEDMNKLRATKKLQQISNHK